MNTIVIYASTSGNTRAVAEAIASGLRTRGTATVVAVDDAADVPEADLLVIGAPTEGHTASKPMAAWLERLPQDSFRRRAVAAFDTRLNWPRFLSGSAAGAIARRARDLGANIVAEPESFMVSTKPELERGELGRATAWATQLVDSLISRAEPGVAVRG